MVSKLAQKIFKGIVQFGHNPEGFWKEVYCMIGDPSTPIDEFVPEHEFDVGEDPLPLDTAHRPLNDDEEDDRSGSEDGGD